MLSVEMKPTMLNVVMLYVVKLCVIIYLYAACRYAECYYGECYCAFVCVWRFKAVFNLANLHEQKCLYQRQELYLPRLLG